jgi:ribonuclease HI
MERLPTAVRLITDGGCRGNPGLGAIGFLLLDENNRVLAKVGKCIGNTTNNRAEYQALIEGLDYASRYTRESVHCFLDSELVIRQVKEEWKIKEDELRELFSQVLIKESAFKQVTYTHLSRIHPMIRAVDKIVNQSLDEAQKRDMMIKQ